MKKITLVIFGITGDLSKKKLLPAVRSINEKSLVDLDIVGIFNRPREETELEALIDDEKLYQKCRFVVGNIGEPELCNNLKKEINPDNDIIFYLATLPSLYSQILNNIKSMGLEKKARIVLEKPFGDDEKSAKELNNLIKAHYPEDRIFRIDHYLGKETIQNILTFRFNNPIFVPIWNKKYIDHIQITVAENIGAENRGNYYDNTGALKDVGQNHLIQMLAFATMNKPRNFSDKEITQKRLQVIKNLVPSKSLVLGQYEGYGNEFTNTFFALKTELNMDNFKGVPIFMRAGKKLKTSVAEISIIFKHGNVLTFRIQPNEGIVLSLMVKKPGITKELEKTTMQFCYHTLNNQILNPYEKLLLDVVDGDQTFFNNASEVEASWKFIDELKASEKKIFRYKEGSFGPKESDDLIKGFGKKWLEPAVGICQK